MIDTWTIRSITSMLHNTENKRIIVNGYHSIGSSSMIYQSKPSTPAAPATNPVPQVRCSWDSKKPARINLSRTSDIIHCRHRLQCLDPVEEAVFRPIIVNLRLLVENRNQGFTSKWPSNIMSAMAFSMRIVFCLTYSRSRPRAWSSSASIGAGAGAGVDCSDAD